MKLTLPSFSLLSTCLLGLVGAGCASPLDDHAAQEPHSLARPSEGGGGWLEPWPEHHESQHESPFVHNFGVEPAFLDRDLFVDMRRTRASDSKEFELAAELEWALTRRIGLLLEVPFARLSPDAGSSQSGLGDIALALRLLLIESPTFLLSSNLEFAFPSASKSKGLGSGETGFAPSLSAWFKLPGRLQASAQIGTETGLDSEDTQLFYGAGLAYAFPQDARADLDSHDHSSDHAPSGLTSVMLELTGRTALDGPDEGADSNELLFGISRGLTETWGVRAAYQVPIGPDQAFDRALLIGLTYHF